MSELEKVSENNQLAEPSIVDKIEAAIVHTLQLVELPIRNIFTAQDGKNLYGRGIFIPEGAVLTSRVHKYQHQFVIAQGRISVYDETTGKKEILQAPYHGVTEPGTRRALHALKDTVWITFHITESTDPDEIVNKVSYTTNNKLLEELLI